LQDSIFEVTEFLFLEILTFFSPRLDTSEKAYHKIHAILEGTAYQERLNLIFVHLNAVLTYLKRLKVRRKIYINPLSSYNNKFYKGNVLFQCLHDTKRRDVFAAGGRYDRLIQDMSKISSVRSQARAVGFNLKFDSLCASMSSFVKNTGKAFLKQGDAELQGLWKTRKVQLTLSATCLLPWLVLLSCH
jgi:translation initiation factor 2-alpha kinase 4